MQVKQCMQQAKNGVAYKAPPAPAVKWEPGARRAHPSMADEEVRKSSPDGETGLAANTARRLGEGTRHGESEEWEGEWTVIILLGDSTVRVWKHATVCARSPLTQYSLPPPGQPSGGSFSLQVGVF